MSFSYTDTEELRTKFETLFQHDAYAYQLRVAQKLLSGQSVILQAPTGAGKTKTALFPFFYARQYSEAADFPRKMLYSVERRILVNSFHREVEELLKARKPLDSNGQALNLKARVLTGERPEDRELRGDLIFTTIDQTLSSFLMTPYSLSARQANLNAGAVCSSYLVFDEAHLFDSETALPTLMWMLQTLKGIVPTLLMTATFSPPLLQKLAEITGGEIIKVEKDELEKIPAQASKKRYFKAVSTPLKAADVLAVHKSRSIVVCNMVDRAQEVFDELQKDKTTDTELILLHARFYQTDRKAKEKRLDELFGKGKAKTGSAILVATQVIEVGVDISCENLHTELAPANTILQRAGRCARYENETGTVQVYQVESKLPYKEEKELFEPTFATIDGFGDQRVTFEMEQSLIEQVHSAKDQHMLEKIKAGQGQRRQMIVETLDSLKPDHLKYLIRDADSRSILVHSNPDELESPFVCETISVFDGTFRGSVKKLQEEAIKMGTGIWALKYPQLQDAKENKQEIERRPPEYKWLEVEPGKDSPFAPVIAVNPLLVSYDTERGFRFKAEAGKLSKNAPGLEQLSKIRSHYDYQRENYAEHIHNVNQAYGYFKFKDEIEFATARLEQKLNLADGLLDRAIRLSFVFHDAGKLTDGWQKVGHSWQKQVIQDNKLQAETMLAHTDFVWAAHKDKEPAFKQKFGSRPPHAVEGAYIAQKFLSNTLGEKLARPVVTAIARHHAPTALDLSNYKLHRAAGAALEEALQLIQAGEPWKLLPDTLPPAKKDGLSQLDRDLITMAGKSTSYTLVYMLIVRVLRLADQASFEFARVHSKKA